MAIKIKSSGGSTWSGEGDPLSAGQVGWEEAPTEFTKRCVMMNIYGDTGTGRTRLALTAPGPIGLAHTAEKIQGVVQEFSAIKPIKVINFGGTFRGSPQQIADQSGPLWNRMSSAWYNALDSWAKSLIMDTDTEGWEILRLARFGELNPKGRTDALYGPVNAEWRSLFKRQRSQDRCNVIAISQTKDEYREVIRQGQKSSERTGDTIRAGQKEIPYAADVIVRTYKEITNAGIKFTAKIEKAWFNAHAEGLVLENDDVTFAKIMALITDTGENEWM